MRSEIIIPMVGMTMTEATVVEWMVPDGGTVKPGDPILAFETDKSTLEIEAEAAGKVRHGAEIGVVVAPGAVVGWLDTDGD
jgi:pyruvate/2-oxoglutarate dehydrogenase complex dihydrolipoamide acyltransferase (E2) component